MADQINMGALSLAEQQQGGRSYIPPHMRSRGGGGPAHDGPPGPDAPAAAPLAAPLAAAPPGAQINGGLNNSAWAG